MILVQEKSNKPPQDLIIVPNTVGFTCHIDPLTPPCIFQTDTQILELDTWNIYGAQLMEEQEGSLCIRPTLTWTLRINDNGWKNVSATTAIKITSGLNPKKADGQSPEFTCNAENSPRVDFPVQAQAGTNCQTYNMALQAVDSYSGIQTTNFDIIIDDGTCEIKNTSIIFTNSENQYIADFSMMYWFLGICISLSLMWYLKLRNKK